MIYQAIVGSRKYPNLDIVKRFIDDMHNIHTVKDITIVSGGAHGVDKCAEWYSKRKGFNFIGFYADWSKGKQAGFERNTILVNFIKEHEGTIHAFWDGKSRGTLDTIHKAEDARVRLFVYNIEGLAENEEIPF